MKEPEEKSIDPMIKVIFGLIAVFIFLYVTGIHV